MTYGSGLPFSDSVNLGSNPSPPAIETIGVSGASQLSGGAEQTELTEQTAHTGRTKVGTGRYRRPLDSDATGNIYFLTDGEKIKIGFSASPMERMRCLQLGHGSSLSMIASTSGTFRDERELHKKFAGQRLRGEWFRSTPELLGFIDGYCPDAARVRALRSDIEQAIASITAWGNKTTLGPAKVHSERIATALKVLFKNPDDMEARKNVLAATELVKPPRAEQGDSLATGRLTAEAVAALMAASHCPVIEAWAKQINGPSVSDKVT